MRWRIPVSRTRAARRFCVVDARRIVGRYRTPSSVKSNWMRLFGLARTPPALGPRLDIKHSCTSVELAGGTHRCCSMTAAWPVECTKTPRVHTSNTAVRSAACRVRHTTRDRDVAVSLRSSATGQTSWARYRANERPERREKSAERCELARECSDVVILVWPEIANGIAQQ